jgi:TonB-linked SusC/RagA family outer membrane protein
MKMKNYLSLCILIALLGLSSSLLAQITVKGRITDGKTGETLPSVSIVDKVTGKGSLSDLDGNYSIETSADGTLSFSFVGYASLEEKVGGRTNLDILLTPTAAALSEVVVVGYGTQKKANLTGAVNQFKTEDLTQRQVSSTSQLLQGIAPGVQVWQSSGKPGADGPNIRIRGIGSISSGTGPLVMIDGVVTTMDFLDPNSIESMTVLKDAASTAIYGVRGANGVVVIKTKRSKRNGVHVQYNNFVTQQQATEFPEKVTALEHMQLSNVAKTNFDRRANPNAPESFAFAPALVAKYSNSAPDNIEVFNSNWADLVLSNTGIMHNHNVIVDAGSEKVGLLTSVSFLDQQGLIPNNSFRKLDIRMNPDIQLTKSLRLSGNFFFNQGNRVEPAGSSPEFIIRQAIGLPANTAAFEVLPDGRKVYGDAGQSNRRNPLGQAESSGINRILTPSLLGSVQVNFTPVKGLDLEVMAAREQGTPNSKRFQVSYDSYNPNPATRTWEFVTRQPGTNNLSESYGFNYRNTYRAQASYQIERNKHNARLMAGTQSEENVFRSTGASRTNFVNENKPFLSLGGSDILNSGGGSDNALIDVFGRFNYAFDDKYLLEVNGCYSGTSRFFQPLGKQWDFFPSVSAGWLFTQEKFLKNQKFMDYGKIRGSWGVLGNQGLPDNYPFAGTYSTGNYYFNNTTNLGFAFTEAFNAGISYEKSTQSNVGLELSFLQGKLDIVGEYFVKEISQLLLRRPIPVYTGLSPAYENLGAMENRGWEFQANYRDKIGKLRYSITAMISDVQNKILELPGLPRAVINGQTTDPFLDEGLLRSTPGQALRSYFGYRAIGYYQSTEDITASKPTFFTPKPGDIKYEDINGDGKVDANDREFIGNNFPRYEYSFNLNLSYFGFDLSAFVHGVGMKQNYISGTGAFPFFAGDFVPSLLAIHKDYWTPTNPNAAFPQLLPNMPANNTIGSSFWVRNAAYWRLKNVNLGYNLPKSLLKKIGFERVRLYASGQNLFTKSKFWKGYDPEQNNNTGEFYPILKTYTVGINLGF